MVLDDLHWADPDSLKLLEFTARQLAGRRLLLAGTYRDVEAGDRLRRVAATAEMTRLEGLETAHVGELMAQVTGEPAAEEIAAGMQARTGGNPLFVRELTRLLQARRPGVGSWPGAANLDSVREVIDRRLARLSQSCIRMLTVAALDGTTLRPWLLARVLGDDADLPALIEEAAAARVAVTEGDRTRPRFAHDLFREVLAAELPVPARRAVHRDLATALEAARADGAVVHPAELAAHFAAAATAGDAAACEPAVRFSREAAADAARRLAFEDAVAHLERALVVLDPTRPGPAARLGLLLEVADARRLAGHLPDAATTYGDAFSAASRLGESQIAARAAIGLHQTGVKTGPSAERDHHAAVLASAIDAIGDHPGPLAARLHAALARTLYHSLEAGLMARAAQIAEHAVELAQGSGDAEATGEALLALHDVRWRPGHAKQRLEVLGRLEVASGQDRLRHLIQLLRAQALVELGDPRALSEIDAYCSAADRNGDPVSRWQSLSRRAAAELLAGRLDTATEQAERAAQLAELLGDADAVWISDIQRWELARFTSGRGGYRRHRPGSPPPVETWAPWRALILADAGDTDGATAALAGFTASQAWGPGVNASYDLWFPAIAAEAAARCGASGLQAGLYELLAPYAGTQVGCGAWVAYCGAVDYYLGLLTAAQGRHAAAAAHFDAATVQHLRLGVPLWAELAGSNDTASVSSPAGPHPAASSQRARSGRSRSAASRPTSRTAKGCTTSPCCWPAPDSQCPPANWRAPSRHRVANPPSTGGPSAPTAPGCATSMTTSPRPRPATTWSAPPVPAWNAMPSPANSHDPWAAAAGPAGWATTPKKPARPSPPASTEPCASSTSTTRRSRRTYATPCTPAQPAATIPPTRSTGSGNNSVLGL